MTCMRMVYTDDLLMDDHDRPFRRTVKGQRWPGLWAHVIPPLTGKGILLWQDGRTLVVDSWDNYDTYADADDRVAGGYIVQFDDTDWQYQVMVDAGFTFELCVVPESDIYLPLFTPVF